ncbi:rod shape-determining protein MreC [Adlercreutzia sp. ZJ242]|uniref:rod shape-determining protein MreC n=1 Tax=Adlercreutzia sp. ZJ242 TaxID=2709409 RepID=UPI0013E9C010|nr:rod shape-determining protein MreC [Adlercreutzia sp. ZJ242]
MALNFQDRGSASATRVLLVVLVVVSVACMTIYAREGAGGPLHAVQSAFAGVAAPFKAAGTAVGAAGEGAAEAVADATASEETLTALRERNAELTELVTQAEEYRLEAERLSGLLELKSKYQVDGVSGRVIGRSTDAWNQRVTIDVGTSDGVEPGLTVMGPAGVVGQVVSASPGSAEVRLLTDPQSGAAAVVQSSRAEGVVRGSLAGLLYLENVDADVTLSVGDVVLTSGLGGSYTRGLLIGTIVRVDGNANDGTRRVIVSPNEQATSFEEVIVVKSAAADSASGGSGSSGSDAGSGSGGNASSSSSSAGSASSAAGNGGGGQ